MNDKPFRQRSVPAAAPERRRMMPSTKQREQQIMFIEPPSSALLGLRRYYVSAILAVRCSICQNDGGHADRQYLLRRPRIGHRALSFGPLGCRLGRRI